MERIDVIMLANNIDDKHYNLSRVTIDSLRKTLGDVQFNVIIVESNKDSEYSFEGCTIIKPNLEFNYAEFVNIGYRECHNEWIMIINNDLEFTPNWFNEVLDVYEKNNGIESFSFYEPDYHGKYFSSMFNDSEDVYEGYEVGPRISGWCILHRRSVLNKIKRWDNRFPFYYVDDDYGQSIKSMGIRNAMLKKSIVYHRVSQSHDTIPDLINQKATEMAKKIYEHKWSDKNKPFLSVIIPSYNFEKYIIQCIESVISQITNFDFEILIRDDNSGDSTNQLILDRFWNDSRVLCFESCENIGPYENIKFLLGKAKGKYIAYLDGDDYYDDPNKLQKQVDFLENNPDYVMHSTGYRYVDEDNNFISPCDDVDCTIWLHPTILDVKTEDILDNNLVGFGRVFRNIPDLLRPEYYNITYIDWVINLELSFFGKIRCEEWSSGCYRISNSGVFSKVSEEEKNRERIKISGILKKRYRERLSDQKKVISIVDCYVHDKKVEHNLNSLIDKLKKIDQKILLVSNTPVDKEITKKVDYFLYDSRNQLFQKEYDGINMVDFWVNHGGFTVHNLKSGFQKHGLSVLINLFNCLRLAKSLGFTHFHRFESDDLHGDNSLKWISKIPEKIISSGNKGIFYLNHGNTPPDASFHYFFCEIDHFLNIIPEIKSEEDYENYLIKEQGKRDFKIVECFLYDHIKKSNYESLEVKEGAAEMNEDFSDTLWNTVVSGSNLSEKYKGCLSGVYRKIDKDGCFIGYCLYSQNYIDRPTERLIEAVYSNGEKFNFFHSLPCKGAWCTNDLDFKPDVINIYENGELIYMDKTGDESSYIEIH